MAVNIGPKERAKRRIVGIAGIVAAIGLGYWMVQADLPRIARLAVMIPLGIGILGFLQAAAGT